MQINKLQPTREWIFIESDNKKSIIQYYEDVLDNTQQMKLLNIFSEMNDFVQDEQVPRTQKWYDVNNRYFCEQWKKRYPRWESFKYTNDVIKLQNYIQQFINTNLSNDLYSPVINSCLINKYRNGNDSISAHRDTNIAFGPTPTIVNLSIGETRSIIFKRIKYDENNLKKIQLDPLKQHENFEIQLKSGSIMIMGGETQKYFSHEIAKDDSTNCRYSFTFREKL